MTVRRLVLTLHRVDPGQTALASCYLLRRDNLNAEPAGAGVAMGYAAHLLSITLIMGRQKLVPGIPCGNTR
jgi:hypothetical protein